MGILMPLFILTQMDFLPGAIAYTIEFSGGDSGGRCQGCRIELLEKNVKNKEDYVKIFSGKWYKIIIKHY